MPLTNGSVVVNTPWPFGSPRGRGFFAGAVGLPGPPVILMYNMVSTLPPAAIRANNTLSDSSSDLSIERVPIKTGRPWSRTWMTSSTIACHLFWWPIGWYFDDSRVVNGLEFGGAISGGSGHACELVVFQKQFICFPIESALNIERLLRRRQQ